MNAIGIENIGIYPSSLMLEVSDLASARGGDAKYLHESIMVRERCLVPLWEDAVTLAVNSASGLLEQIDRSCIGLLIIATESGIDQEKAVSTWVHRHLQLPAACRVLEVKSACHAGAAALKMIESWIGSGLNRGKKALLINVDISNNMLDHGKMEYSLGAGAVALLVSDKPTFAVIETGKSAGHTHEVTDVIRPLPWKEVAFDVEASLYSYLDGLERTFEEYARQTPAAMDAGYFDYNIYHVPFPGMSRQAHKLLLELQGVSGKDALTASFDLKVDLSLHYPQRFGATYCGSIFLCLFSLFRRAPDLKPGQRVGIYSYGSGSCAEFFSMLVGEGAQEAASRLGETLDTALARRRKLSVPEYEQLETERSGQAQGRDYAVNEADLAALSRRGAGETRILILERIESHLRSYRHV
jgi:3-hydroxy-3-methylglutaryl CoA synthase